MRARSEGLFDSVFLFSRADQIAYVVDTTSFERRKRVALLQPRDKSDLEWGLRRRVRHPNGFGGRPARGNVGSEPSNTGGP